VVFFFMFRTEKDIDPDAVTTVTRDAAGGGHDASATQPPQFSPDPEARHEPEPRPEP